MRSAAVGASACALALAVLMLAACGDGSGTPVGASSATAEQAEEPAGAAGIEGDTDTNDEVGLVAALTAGAVIPQPGAIGASGTAWITLHPGRGEVCFEITVTELTEVTGAHLHAGEAGATGPVVLGLQAPREGTVEGCVSADTSLIGAIAHDPAEYYLNVRTEAHPGGALRGQLG